MLRKPLTTLCLVVALAVPVTNALALTREARVARSKVVTTETVTGPVVKCHQWGFLSVQLKLIKTVITNGSAKPEILLKVAAVSWPVWPTHTPRSIYINTQALPLLQGETLSIGAKSVAKLDQLETTQMVTISGASNLTVSWVASLQAALLKAETPTAPAPAHA
jgi:hypothetical protein